MKRSRSRGLVGEVGVHPWRIAVRLETAWVGARHRRAGAAAVTPVQDVGLSPCRGAKKWLAWGFWSHLDRL